MSERLSDEKLAVMRRYADTSRRRIMVGFSPTNVLAALDELAALRVAVRRVRHAYESTGRLDGWDDLCRLAEGGSDD